MNNKKTNIIIISIFFILLSVLLYGKTGNVLIDFSRESYIPYQMLQGDKLGIDIFLIYGPFGYFLNMFLYKIALNVNIILFEALFISYVISILFYFIVKKYTTSNIALIFSLFFIAVSIFSNSNFSFVLPYSYSTLWAILALYFIFFSFLYKKVKLRYVLLGFVAINKVELFILTLVFFIGYDLYYKKFNIKNYLLILIVPAIFMPFFINTELLNNTVYIKKMMSANALQCLYKGMGGFFEINYFLHNLLKLVIYFTISVISYFIYKYNRIISLSIPAILFIFIEPTLFLNLGFFIAIILSAINIKKIKNRDVVLLIFSAILCSKALFVANPLTYSNFGYCLLIFYIFRQFTFILNKSWLSAHSLIIMIFILISQFIGYYKNPKTALKTEIGKFELAIGDYELIVDINNYLSKNIKENENMVVVPEGQIINLMNKISWGFFNSTFTPLDFEIFKEENIINKLKKNKTEYIIFYPRTTEDYGAPIICYDYGVDFCSYIMDNYTRVAMFGDKRKALIFRINEK